MAGKARRMKMAVKVAVVTITYFVASALALAAQMTELEFTNYFVQRAQQSLPSMQIQVVGPLQLHSKDAKGYQVTTFLNNAYTQYTASPERLASIVDSQIRALGSQSEVLAAKEAAQILAVVKPADYLATVKKQLERAGVANREVPLVFRKLNDDLYAFYVFDTETGMRMITPKDLAQNKIDERDLIGLAARNLTAYFDKNGVRFRRLEKVGNAKIYAVTLDQNYEASILLLNQYWDKRTFDVAGDVVVFLPARNTVFVTGSEDAEGMRIAGLLASKGFKELGYSISPYGYTQQGGEWKRYAP